VTDPVFHLPGLFWMVRLEDDQFQVRDGGRSASLQVTNLLEFDRFQFLGPGNVKMHLTFHIDYTRDAGKPTFVEPTSTDPLSPFNWAGVMWNAKAKGTFSAAYDDGSFSVRGTTDSASTQPTIGIVLPFGHMGFEANGVFTRLLEAPSR
jgi:hypothetical protein